MIPVDQTRFGHPEGNCLTAALASIMELAIEDLPDLFEECCGRDEEGRWTDDAGRHWWTVLQEAAHGRGWHLVCIGGPLVADLAPQGYAIAGGDSPRPETVDEDGENAGHVVVCRDGELVHDPHPSRDGLGGPVEDWILALPPRGWAPRGTP